MANLNFEWVPFFKELAVQLLKYENNQIELVSILEKIGIEKGLNDQNPEGVIIPMMEIDPFTFFSLITKFGTDNKKFELFNKVKDFIKLENPVPKTYEGVPISNAQSAWFFRYKFDRQENDVKHLWTIYKESLNGAITEESFNNALSIKLVGNAKLTQGLFCASPDKYFPINVQTKPYLKKLDLNDNPQNLHEYLKVCEELLSRGIPLYKQSYLAWEQRDEQEEPSGNEESGDALSGSNDFQDLSELFLKLQAKAKELELKEIDQEIPFEFQEKIKEAGKVTHEITFESYCSKLVIKRGQNRLIVPNIAFYMAIEAVPIYKAIKLYNDTFITIYKKFKQDGIINLPNAEKFYQELIKPVNITTLKKTFDDATELYLKEHGKESQQNLERFRKFVYQKSWSCAGIAEGKNPGRTDPQQSAILLAFGVSQANQGFIFELTGILSESNDDFSKFSLLTENYNSEVIDSPKNLIVYGAPGTGKSHYLKNLLKYANTFRTVFHSETQNSDFVGSLKPVTKVVDGVGKVTYEFVAGPFIRAFVEALNQPNKQIHLIIEEINRANAAAVFGEIFQLLDRDATGRSEYVIQPDELLAKYLEDRLGSKFDGLIYIPSNLIINATMNSSDQGVYPLDSAFKRRWSFKYMPIDFQDSPKGAVNLDGRRITWDILAKSINEILSTEYAHLEEDRFIGPWFLNKNEVQLKFSEAIESKLFTYLWSDVLRHQQRDKIFNALEINSFSDLIKVFNRQLAGDQVDVFSEIVHQAFDRYIAEATPVVVETVVDETVVDETNE
jgi:hypothetical protein